jgi:exopolysaccharide biosynthesis polyprenyl glycosylphosphotransferase
MRAQTISRLGLTLFLSDLILVPLGLLLASELRLIIPLGQDLPESAARLPLIIYLIAIVLWLGASVANGVYEPAKVLRWYQEFGRVTGSAITGTALIAGTLYMSFRQVSRLQFIYFFLLTWGLILAHRAILRLYHRLRGKPRPGWSRRILVIGAGDLGEIVARVILNHSRWGYQLFGFLDDDPAKRGKTITGVQVLGGLHELRDVVESNSVDEVWIALPARAHDRVEWIVAELEKTATRIKVVPDYYSLALVRAKTEILGGIPFIGLREPIVDGSKRLIKRIFDLLVALITLVLLSPLLLLLALLIRLDSSGPVIFHQKRVGENGRIFDMYKFRTMTAGAEDKLTEILASAEGGKIIHKKPDDPRITRIGHVLRRLSMDELPQLFNVLKGDMSLVGPRPEMPWLVDRYDPWQRKRFAVPQGITGWWQINGRSDKPMHLHTEDDLYYVYNYSFWLDLQILLRTPWAVLRGKGAF